MRFLPSPSPLSLFPPVRCCVAKNSFAPTATDSIIHGRTAPPNRASPRRRRRADQRRPHTNGTRHSRRPTPTTTLYLYASRKPVRPHELSRVSRNSTLQRAARETMGAMPSPTRVLPRVLTVDDPEKRHWNGATRWCVRLISSFFSLSFSTIVQRNDTPERD